MAIYMRSDPLACARIPRRSEARGFGRKPYSAHNLIINACRPYEWKDDFPRVSVNGPELRRATEQKWPELLES